MKENSFQSMTVNRVEKILNQVCTVAYQIHSHNSIFVSPIYTFSPAGNLIVYTPSQDTNMEKFFNYINYKEKNANSGGKLTLFHPFLPS